MSYLSYCIFFKCFVKIFVQNKYSKNDIQNRQMLQSYLYTIRHRKYFPNDNKKKIILNHFPLKRVKLNISSYRTENWIFHCIVTYYKFRNSYRSAAFNMRLFQIFQTSWKRKNITILFKFVIKFINLLSI